MRKRLEPHVPSLGRRAYGKAIPPVQKYRWRSKWWRQRLWIPLWTCWVMDGCEISVRNVWHLVSLTWTWETTTVPRHRSRVTSMWLCMESHGVDELSQGILGREEDLENYILRVPNLVTSGGMKAYRRLKRRKRHTKGPCHGKQGKRFQKRVLNRNILITNANMWYSLGINHCSKSFTHILSIYTHNSPCQGWRARGKWRYRVMW